MAQETGKYKIKTIAELTGFSPNLLRAWERRYELLEPARKESGHRLYTETDLAVLKSVRLLVDEGRSIGEIALMGRDLLVNSPPTRRAPKTSTSVEKKLVAGGTPQAERLVEQIVEAALKLEVHTLQSLLDEGFARLPSEDVFSHVMIPSIRRLGNLWHTGRATVAHEHLVSGLFLRRLYQWLELMGRTHSTGPKVVTACLPDEQHEIGALLVTFYLSKLGAEVTYLGSMPLADLEAACRELRPRFVLFSVTQPVLLEIYAERLNAMISRLDSIHFVVGGEGLQEPSRLISNRRLFCWPEDRPLEELATLWRTS